MVSNSLRPHGLQPARLLCPWGFARQEYWSGLPCPPPGDLPNPGIESRSHALQVDSLLTEPPAKPKNTAVGSLSLLQGIFLTQESSQCLLHCRQILSKLSYQGSPISIYWGHTRASMVAHMVKNLSAMQETQVWSLGWEHPLCILFAPTVHTVCQALRLHDKLQFHPCHSDSQFIVTD